MRRQAILGAIVAFAVGIAAPCLAARAQGAETWATAAPADGSFTVETPCGAEAIADLRERGNPIPGIEMVPQSQVACVQGSMLFVAGEIAADELPAGELSMFDIVADQISRSTDVMGSPRLTMLAGRRALVNREERDGRVAQTGVIEISRTRVILLVAGAGGSGPEIVEQEAAIDRFYRSIAVSGN